MATERSANSLELTNDYLQAQCLRSTRPIHKTWQHIGDAQQAILELWWFGDDKSLIERFGGYSLDREGRSTQFFNVLNRIDFLLRERRVQSLDLNSSHPMLYSALLKIETELGAVLVHCDKADSPYKTVTLEQIIQGAIDDKALPNTDEARELLVAFWLYHHQFYRDFLPALPNVRYLDESPVWQEKEAMDSALPPRDLVQAHKYSEEQRKPSQNDAEAISQNTEEQQWTPKPGTGEYRVLQRLPYSGKEGLTVNQIAFALQQEGQVGAEGAVSKWLSTLKKYDFADNNGAKPARWVRLK